MTPASELPKGFIDSALAPVRQTPRGLALRLID